MIEAVVVVVVVVVAVVVAAFVAASVAVVALMESFLEYQKICLLYLTSTLNFLYR